ncbi:serine/threonine-protein kinase [Streptomyces sp. NBC_01304]|uniref:serine/threonine-protein kinase n=1 Tax=Streptomyces sp. NBC_01304 TaxID=2903818 RepID=UPI002E0E650A|nr:serine/threonine protein kinase [Streptomyces sp. NBC_01304]
MAESGGTVRVVAGRYRIGERIGEGGMGTVWAAVDEVVRRPVAVKEPRLPEGLGPDERAAAYERIVREARAAGRIQHPSVVTVHDVVEQDGRPYIVMELVAGQSLETALEQGTLGPREAARVGLAVVRALRAAHSAGVLHRDVKPANVLLGADGQRVVLTDFGIAYAEGDGRLTEPGGFVGSPEYVAPERALGRSPGAAADLWSVGVLLYRALEGVSPFRRDSQATTVQAVLHAEPGRPLHAGPLEPLVMRLLAKDPDARPEAGEVEEALQEASASAVSPSAASTGTVRLRADPSSTTSVTRGKRRFLSSGAAMAAGGAATAIVVAAVTLLLVQPWDGAKSAEGAEDDGKGTTTSAPASPGPSPSETPSASETPSPSASASPSAPATPPPSGWRRVTEKQLTVALAVPKGWQVHERDRIKTNWHSPDDKFTLGVKRDNAYGPTAAEAAKGQLAWYRKTAESSMAGITTRTHRTRQGDRDAVWLEIDYHWNGQSGPRKRLELFVPGTGGRVYQLHVDNAATPAALAEQREYFDAARAQLRTDVGL